MRKYGCILLLFLLVLSLPVTVAASGITVVVDGKNVEFEHCPVLENGRILVPVRELFTAMGAVVSWDDVTRTALAELDNVKVSIPVGSYLPTINAIPVAIDVPAMFISNRTYIPLRFAVESLGGDVQWKTAEGTALITTAAAAAAMVEEDRDGKRYEPGRININTASLENLLAIEGLSKAVAVEIIAYRDTNGGFRTYEDIRNLPSMTDALFDLLLANIQIIYKDEGVACWYGDKFHGRMTSSGEVYDKNLHTAAHRTLPFGTMVKVTYRQTGRSVWVRINDRGPGDAGRMIDLSRAAADIIGLTPHGLGRVELEIIMEI